MHPLRLLVVTASLLPLLTLCAGCGGNTRVAMPGEQDLADVRAGRKSLVLVRGLVTTEKGRLGTAFGPDARRGSTSLCVARLGPRAALESVGKLRSPAAAALRDGWVYVVLPPGTYYLSTDDVPYTPARATAAPADVPPAEAEAYGWLLDVPAGAPVVYAGTLVFVGKAGTEGGGPPARIANESARARVLSSKHLAMFPPARPAVAQPYLGPVDRTVAAWLDASAVQVDGAPQARGFDVRGSVVQDAAHGGLGVLDMMAQPSSDVGMGGLLILIGGAAWAGGGAAVGAVAGGKAAREYQPCVDEAVQRARAFKMSERIQASLAGRLGGAGGGSARPAARAADASRPTLHVVVESIRLRPCAKAHLACFEVRCRARLFDPASAGHLMDRVVLYSNDAARYRLPPYGEPLEPYVWTIDESPAVDFRALAKAPPEERRRRVDAELERAAAVIAERIAGDLRPSDKAAAPKPPAKKSG